MNISVLTGSVRPTRFNIQPAEWITALAKQRTDIEVTLLDLAEENLPFLDEQATPSSGKYDLPHTQRWAEKIAHADGFIFVTPEYNHSISPVLKNAVDFLYNEWNFKPVSFVSYGGLVGGSRSIEHWRGISAELKMFDLRETVMLPNYWDHLDETGKYLFTEEHDRTANHLLDQLIFWAKTMKAARANMAEMAGK